MKKLKFLKFLTSIVLFVLTTFFTSGIVFASSTDGTIDAVYKYAWGENIGWINFGTSGGNVHITDSGLTGYVWSENYGWINLNPSTAGVQNDGNGNLSGKAWSEGLGWIDFSGVTINNQGEFLGYAIIVNDGSKISFNCLNTNSCSQSDFKVKTDWRPKNVRSSSSSPRTYSSGSSSGSKRLITMIKEIPENIIEKVKTVGEIITSLTTNLINKYKTKEIAKPSETPTKKITPEEIPLVFKGKWQLLTYSLERLPLTKFTLAPLPKKFRELAQKFPELEKTFKEVGIVKITDVAKLKSVKLTLPGLTQRVGPEGVGFKPTLRGKIALPKGLPVAKLSPQMKQQLPTEIVFAKTGGELIDFNIALSVNDKGEPQQKIETISGKPLQLVVKPDKPVKSIKGYVVFKSKANQPTSLEFPLNYLLASMIFAHPVFAKPQEKPVRVEEKLVLLEFEYTDPDGDGIYTAEIDAPLVAGEYEIITVMDFEDPELGKKEIRLTTVVDPEGYIYERNGDKETRIPGAIVSLYWLNPETKQYELWSAKEYQQENPQTTDVRGTYSFLVPEGYYYLKVEAPGYLTYDGKPFQVKEGSGIHINIELKTKYWWLKVVDWKTIVMIIFGVLLLYNFYRDRIREKQK